MENRPEYVLHKLALNSVTALNGNVRLTGQVNSDRERQRAVEIADGVKGVCSVSNEIGIR